MVSSMDPEHGGPSLGIRNFAGQMKALGDFVEVVCLDDPRADFLTSLPLPVHALGRGRSAWRYHPKLRPWLQRNLPRFDAVILNGLWQYPGYALLQASRRRIAPSYVVFPHGMLDPWFQRSGQRRFKAVRNWLYWKAVEQRVVGNAAALLFTSTEEMRLARGTFRPYRPACEISVGYGVAPPPNWSPDMQDAFLEKCPGLQDKPYLLFIGRVHPKKGLDLLIKAYAALCSDNAAAPKLVIAGPGAETDYGRKLRRLAAHTCPRNSVLWPGMLAGQAKWGALYLCQASILPSHQENFGLAVVESLACSRPVLISDQVNIWREIHEEGAALVRPNSAEGITQLLQDWSNLCDAHKTEMASRAAVCFQRHFSIEAATHRLQEVLTSTLNRRRSPSWGAAI